MSHLLSQIETAYRSGDYGHGLALVKRVLEFERTDISTLDRVGSIYYVLGRYGEAMAIWEKALLDEQDADRRRGLKGSIAVARRSLGLAPEQPPQRTAPRPKRRRLPPDPDKLESLYQAGVKHYARGEYLQAMNTFLRVLELDPDHDKAARALKRLHLEQPSDTP